MGTSTLSIQAFTALAHSLHAPTNIVEAIRDQWLIVTAILVVAAAMVWLLVRR